MKCPACDRELQKMTVSDITVDVCRNGCGGIWFDNFELQKMDEKHEAAGESLLDIKIDPSVSVDESKTRMCPICENQKMIKHFRSVNKQIEIDECPKCGGVWLDQGELRQIREQFEDDEARHQAAKEFFTNEFGDKLAKMREESEESLRRATKFARTFRFFCPSYFIPGKQDWGAF